jgi:IS605 OrfB family transposase
MADVQIKNEQKKSGGLPRLTDLIQSYPFKLPQQAILRQSLEALKLIVSQASTQLLERLWSEEWLDKLANSPKMAYKVINEHQVVLSREGHPIYLPSRIRRGIAERVGRILRSQVERKACYEAVLRIVLFTGVEGNLDKLVRTVAYSLIQFEGKYYRWVLIRQILRTFRRYYYRLGVDFAVFTTFPYTKIIHPTVHSFLFPYAPDDGQIIQLDWKKNEISVRLKLPRTTFPFTRSDWEWHHCTLAIPPKLLQRVSISTSKLRQPSLRYITLKGGLYLPFLEIPFVMSAQQPRSFCAQRVLATDLGVINLLTSVICEAGSQISPPQFWSPNTRVLQKIDALYHHVSKLQKKLAKYPNNWKCQGKRRQEQDRLYQKLNRFRELILHLASNVVLETAISWECPTIVLEDLRTYEPPKHKRRLSRKLSNWIRGAFYEVLLYKARRIGLKVKRVSARWTSSYCPRCGAKGQKVTDPLNQFKSKKGRFFSCPACGYMADRDYVGAVNIYRMFREHQHKRYSLRFAKPVSYMGIGIPPNRPGGVSAHFRMGR